MVILVSFAAFFTTASAGEYGAGCPFFNWYNGTINGSIYWETHGHYAPGGATQTYTFENVPNATERQIARLYPGIWLGSPSPGRVTEWSFTINGNHEDFNFTEPAALPFCNLDCPPEDGTGEHCNVSCTGCGVCSITYNPEPYLNTTYGNNTIVYWTDEQIYQVALFVVYANDSMPEMQYWVKEGQEYPDDEPYLVYFNETANTGPVDPNNVSAAKYYTYGHPGCVGRNYWPNLNGNNIGIADYVYSYDTGGDVCEGSPPGCSAYDYHVFYKWDSVPAGYITTSSNKFSYPHLGRLMVAVFALYYGELAPDQPDLTVTDIEFPDVMRPNLAYTINATINNQGNASANASTAKLYVNDVLNGTASVSALAAGANETVSFAPQVNLSAGCYTFKVVADSGGVINESEETNNETSDDYQVGYAIVVKGDSDWNALVNDTGLPTGSVTYDGSTGTYYIQDLTITNCAGCGISIENTAAPFVVNNCTIHSCKNGGVCLENATNGEITGCEIKDNSGKGIRALASTTYMDITNNSIHNNTFYGIEVGLTTLSGAQIPRFFNIVNNTLYDNYYGIELLGRNCTVKENVIRNNTQYGIYVFGNDSKIYNNSIKYNTNYGLKLYSSAGNCIYGNDFIDNKGGSAVQAYDDCSTNYWNTTIEIGYYYPAGTCHCNYTGNNWTDYSGSDADGDGLGNTAYALDGGASARDYRPLMEQWENYSFVVCGDANCDDFVDVGDIGKLRAKVYQGESLDCAWAGDANCDDFVDVGDIGKLRAKVYQGESLDCCSGCK